jgi:hypothetical protein
MPNPPEPPKPPQRRPYTPASDAELDALSDITPADIERAKAAWEKDAPAPFKHLLDATDASPEDDPAE